MMYSIFVFGKEFIIHRIKYQHIMFGVYRNYIYQAVLLFQLLSEVHIEEKRMKGNSFIEYDCRMPSRRDIDPYPASKFKGQGPLALTA